MIPPPGELVPELQTPLNYDQDVNVGIIGFGKMGILHSGILNLLKPGCVKCIVEKNRMISLGASRLLKQPSFYRNLEDMLDNETLEIVYVTTPTQSHFPIVLRLLEAGVKTIFVEKPPTNNSSELSILEEMKSPEQHVMVGLQKRYSLPVRHAKKILLEGVIGGLKGVTSWIKSSDVLEPTSRHSTIKRGVLLDLGVHLIDLIQWFLEDCLVQEAKSKNIHASLDDSFRAQLYSEGGFKISFEADWSDKSFRRPEIYMEFQGTHGTMYLSED